MDNNFSMPLFSLQFLRKHILAWAFFFCRFFSPFLICATDKWTHSSEHKCVFVLFFFFSHLVRLLLLLVSVCSRSLSQNDDHMFEILRTEMTQLAIASELTRSHYLLIRTVSLSCAHTRTRTVQVPYVRGIYSPRYYRTNGVWFFLLLLIFIPSFF